MIKSVRVEQTAVVVELENGERVREHSATAILLADIWTRMASHSGMDLTSNQGKNQELVKKIDRRIVAARVKR